jgi:hypothetical protein
LYVRQWQWLLRMFEVPSPTRRDPAHMILGFTPLPPPPYPGGARPDLYCTRCETSQSAGGQQCAKQQHGRRQACVRAGLGVLYECVILSVCACVCP